MFIPQSSSCIFLPSIENHHNCFLPVMQRLNEGGISAYILIVNELITHNRTFEEKTSQYSKKCTITFLLSSMNQWPPNIKIIVGNDSDPATCVILRKAQKLGFKIILMQDGWLDHRNIKQPLYKKKSLFNPLKLRLHKFLTNPKMPTRKYIHNLIGQNSDYFLVYSSKAKKEFEKARINHNTIFVTGSPRYQILKRNFVPPQKYEKCNVLFSTVLANKNDLADFELSLSWITRTFPDDLLIIKIHPMENPTIYTPFLSDKIRIENIKISEFLQKYKISYSFCFASTVIYDMLMIGVPIVQLAPPAMLKRSCNFNLDLKIARNIQEFSESVSSYCLNKEQEVGSQYLEDLKKDHNSIDKIYQTIKKLPE